MPKSPKNSFSTYPTHIYPQNAESIIPPSENSCCFTGHRPKYYRFGTDESHPDCLNIKVRVREKCKYLISEMGVSHFISGGALGLDTWAMEEVLALKKEYCHVTLECVLPYAGMIERFTLPDRERYNRIAPQLEVITILNQHYHRYCMQQRNEYMVDHTQYVIAVWTGQRSGTANTVNYARKRGREVLCLNPN